MSSTTAEQQLVESPPDDILAEQRPDIDPAPPVLPAPQIDLSISMDSILQASVMDSSKDAEKLEKLSEENEKLDEKLKELQDRLAAAEQRSKELEARRHSRLQHS